MERKEEHRPSPAAAVALQKISSTVTPDTKSGEKTFDDIVSEILKKNKERAMCLACCDVAEDNNGTQQDCLFYKHENDLVDAGEREMKFPKEMYKYRRDQGARLACYKLWTMLEHGRLGRSRRRPLPVCVEAHIKCAFPVTMSFIGYKENNKKDDGSDSDSLDDDTWEGTDSPLRTYKKAKLE